MEVMEAHGLPLLIHGEVTDPSVDVFDREKLFIETHLEKIVRKFTKLKIVFEHITSQAAAEFVAAAPDNVAATITPQHLMHNRNDMLVGGYQAPSLLPSNLEGTSGPSSPSKGRRQR